MMPSNWATHGRRSTCCSCERQGEAGLGLSLPLAIHSQPPSPWGSVTVDALLICAVKRETALCEPAPNATSPNVLACRAGCGNMARTDTHASQLRDRADEIDQLAVHAPMHIGNRLRANAARLRQAAVTHAATAATAEALR